ncbi:MAG: F0F1 ATP synthase subunit gamma [Pseudomonadota bacterium]|nr:F0F1 ATP synthase subunit gamma [Pseudomonadota bacterium]
MPNLKDLRVRIDSVKSTQKITSAMKMVAAAKLRRAHEQAEAARPFSDRMDRMMSSLSDGISELGSGPKLLVGNGKSDTHLILVMSSDRGLCGGFNTNIVREVVRRIDRLLSEDKKVKLLCVGRKARDVLRRRHENIILESFEDVGRRNLSYADALIIGQKVLDLFERGEFDVCTMVYNTFQSAISQTVTAQQLIPYGKSEKDNELEEVTGSNSSVSVYEFEPDENEILVELLPKNISVQIFRGLLESAASEHGARMTAMDNATRNAGEMIDGLTLTYNRTRQAVITSELIEIISGAEAL